MFHFIDLVTVSDLFRTVGETDRQTDRHTDTRQMHVRFLIDVANV